MRAARARLESARAAADRAAQEALARATAATTASRRLRAALDVLPVGVVVADESGSEVARNRRAAALVTAGTGAAIAAHAVDELVGAAARGITRHETLELHGPPPRTLMLSAEPMAGDDGPGGAVVVVEDVSERRQLEAVRRDFVDNVSHELRTPVGAIAALAEALSDESDAGVMRTLAVRIGAEADRATQIIEDLLDLSRIESGVGGRDRVAVAAVIAAAAQRVQAQADECSIELVVRGVDPTAAVLGDERQLTSAVTNLLDNAVKYSEPGSTVELDVVAGADVRIAVRDQGIGIPTREHERIFERFYRVDRARSRQTGGTGLGLSIVRHVALNHGGTVLVDSREGEGSVFTLVVPAA